jgi:hypothetical protein
MAIVLLGAGIAFGQGATITLQNQDSSTLYYVVDPKDLAGLSPGSPFLASKVAGFFSSQGDVSFSSLAPDASTEMTDLPDGAHLLVGFFAVQDQDDFPVRVITLQVDSSVGNRFYALFAGPAQLTVPRGVGKLAQFSREGAQPQAPAATATAAAQTVQPVAAPQPGSQQPTAVASSPTPAASSPAPAALPPIAAFTKAYDPVVFTQERQGDFSVLPVSQSRAWNTTGTRISSLSGALDNGALRLALTVQGGFSDKVSYFFYVFGTRAAGQENQLTLELAPRALGNKGACLLWRKGASAPQLIGDVSATSTTAEVDIGSDELQSDILAGIGENATVDLTAGWYDRGLGLWEEFFYATFSTAEITAVTR